MKQRMFQPLLAFVILGAALIITALLLFSRKDPAKVERDPVVTPVATITVSPQPETIRLVGYGTVKPTGELQLQPELSKRIVEISPNLTLGGIVEEGEILLRLDARDFEAAVKQASAEVSRAELELKIEKGQQLIAEHEWQLLQKSLEDSDEPLLTESELGRELALRVPHAEEKAAALEAARSKLEQAEINLERTVITAPFQAVVIEETVEIGQLVSPQTTVATLVPVERFWIEATLPIEQLRWIPRQANKLPVVITQELGKEKQQARAGYLERVLSEVAPEGRLARLLVAVKDPLDLSHPESDRRPLLLGAYVRVEIPGPTLPSVYRVPREALREENLLWIMDDEDSLHIRHAEIVFRDETSILVEGLRPGERVVLSRIPVPIEGMALREHNKEQAE